ncbi:hypothetical protein [Yoonia sediminilitoris]|uniref:Uncharacterized protein n=1 Tax=Yoonia sediminilitoris TaxID=1286148 RepID=A0A2T6K6H6_9RHOB|nr:hypothetical protein [Yoonia sediminilitoris]PUB10272.1 hypothetical protein C8N45_12034 [Yoonia sediminilitoris]RCW89780.1 hypothetical protein DFP92_12034 [Yoonia sediminilitoris]
MLFKLLNIFRFGWIGKVMIFLVGKAALNRTPFQKVARLIVHGVFLIPKNNDFMADDFVDNDEGFDLDELRRYQNGETVPTK